MGAWLRNLGLLFILGAGLMVLRACPPPRAGDWQGVRAPLSGAPFGTDATFAAPYTATYFVQVKLPQGATPTLINHLVRPPSGERGKPVSCRISDDAGLVLLGGYRTHLTPAYDGPAYTVGSFTGQAGRPYRVRLHVEGASQAFTRAAPFVSVTLNPRAEYYRHLHPREIALATLGFGFGLLLTFWGGSRVPLRALRP